MVGVLKHVATNKGKFKNANLYIFEDENGEIVGLMGSKVLDDVLPQLIERKVRLTYAGKGKSKKGVDYNLYEIEVWEEELDPLELQ